VYVAFSSFEILSLFSSFPSFDLFLLRRWCRRWFLVLLALPFRQELLRQERVVVLLQLCRFLEFREELHSFSSFAKLSQQQPERLAVIQNVHDPIIVLDLYLSFYILLVNPCRRHRAFGVRGQREIGRESVAKSFSMRKKRSTKE